MTYMKVVSNWKFTCMENNAVLLGGENGLQVADGAAHFGRADVVAGGHQALHGQGAAQREEDAVLLGDSAPGRRRRRRRRRRRLAESSRSSQVFAISSLSSHYLN